MARGFGASESVRAQSRPRAYFEKIQKEITDGVGKLAELKNSGRTFDLEAAQELLDRALTKMANYESMKTTVGRRGFGAAETKSWDLVKNFGLTETEAKYQMMFGTYTLGRMEDIMKEVNAPGNLRRPMAFADALKQIEPAKPDDFLRFTKVTDEKDGYLAQEKAGKFAKGTTVKEVASQTAVLANKLFEIVSKGNMGDKAQQAIEAESAKLYKEWTDKGVARKTAADFLGMAQASVVVDIQEADEISKRLILEEAGFKERRR